MSYLDQPRMTPTRIWAIATVAIIHVLLGIALVTGFANKFVKSVAQDLKVVDIEEPPPPEEEPPPPEDIPEPQAPELVTPPSLVPPPPSPVPPMQTTTVPNPPAPPLNFAPPGPAPTPIAPPPPPPPPPPASPPSPARLRSGSISDADYPAAAQRAEAQGTTTVSYTVGADGRVTGCSVTGSSGNGALDSTTCSLIQRRFRFTPATRDGQPVAETRSQRVVWRLPRD